MINIQFKISLLCKNNTKNRILKNAIIKLLSDNFITVSGFYIDGIDAILQVKLNSFQNVSDVLNILYNRCEEYVKENYLISNHNGFFKKGFTVKIVA